MDDNDNDNDYDYDCDCAFLALAFLGSIEPMLGTSHFARGVVSLARLAHLTSPDPRSPSSPRFLLLNIVRSRAKQMPRAWPWMPNTNVWEEVPGLSGPLSQPPVAPLHSFAPPSFGLRLDWNCLGSWVLGVWTLRSPS